MFKMCEDVDDNVTAAAVGVQVGLGENEFHLMYLS